MCKVDVEAFLMWLVAKRNVSSSTHRQALSALLFLYVKVLGIELPWLDTIGRPREVKRLPVTLSPDEVARIFSQMEGEFLLMAQLLYGTGLRILEAMRLRVKDIDFTRNTIIVREAKGNKDRAVMLPAKLVNSLQAQWRRGPTEQPNGRTAEPKIVSPLRAVTYTTRISNPVAISLRAEAPRDKLFWFANGAFLGQANAG